VDPTTIDVNVHPAKTEVRFLDQNRIFSLIKASIVEKIIHSGLLPAMPLKAADDAPAYLPQARPDSPFEPNWDVQERRMFGRDAEVEARGAHERWTDARHVLDEAFRVVDPAPAHRLTEAPSQTPVTDSPAPTAETGLLAKARGLFQVGATYIMVETEDGVIVIDQHAYHERILYWQLENRIASGPPERQRLLAPMPLDLSSSALELARGHLEQLAEFGFVLEPFGADGLALTATPKYSRPDKHAEVIQSICEDLAAGRKPSGVEGMRKSMVESVACKAAIKAGDVLSPQQIRDLLRLGETVPHTFACPHGRPTTYKLGFIDLEKIFHRR
ncbi:MAG: hypothetical protein OEY28_13170, partial [Nitrospira sp.]|nr:hypothetical protein [Nitrospira sp.]